MTADVWREGRQIISETAVYFGRIRQFTAWDWICYLAWIGTISGLFFALSFFNAVALATDVPLPGYVWVIWLGAGMFTTALAVDTIGHRTVYKAELRKGEASVHHMIIITAVGSVVALCMCYDNPETMRMPALALIGLSLFYSAIDEGMHWRRYLTQTFDRVEMWSHFVAILGHVLLIACWWQWMDAGYPGVEPVFATIRSWIGQ